MVHGLDRLVFGKITLSLDPINQVLLLGDISNDLTPGSNNSGNQFTLAGIDSRSRKFILINVYHCK